MNSQLRIVILEDNPSDAELIKRQLRKAGYDFTAELAHDRKTFLEALDKSAPDIVLADYSLPEFDGLSALGMVRSRYPDVPGIIVSGAIGEEVAIECLKAGATDYVLKDRLNRLELVVQRALREAGETAERRHLEESLRNSEERLRKQELQAVAAQASHSERERLYSIFDTLQVYVALLDQDYHISFANKFFRDRFGESDGRRCYNYLYNRKTPCENCEAYKVITSRHQQHWEQVGCDGRHYDVYGYPFVDVDGSTKSLKVGIDVTERKKANADLLASQAELEKARRLSDIGTLAATVAHELRNPLAAISLAAGNIKRKTRTETMPGINNHLNSHLGTIEKKVFESNQIINNLLYYSRIKPPQYGEVDIFNTVTEAIQSVEDGKKQDVTIVRNLDSLKDISIEACSVQLAEVFVNLLNNAKDAIFCNEGEIVITAEDQNDFIKIVIRDTGTGIDKESLAKIFDPFFTTKARGTGLGLSVCKQIIESHHGSISVESIIGKGTVAIVYLPKKKTNQMQPLNRGMTL